MTTQISPVEPGPVRAAPQDAPRRRGRPGTGVLGLIGLVVVLGAWQLAATLGIINASFASSPSGAVVALVRLVRTGTLWSPLLSTVETVAYGMVIAVVVGIPAGLLIGRSRLLYGLSEPIVNILYSVPFVVFLPIIIFWFGIGAEARTVIVVWSALFPLLINVTVGARNVDVAYLQVARAFCASRALTLGRVAFPATLPYILAGVRQAVGRALVGAIVAELFMGNEGLGYLVQTQTSNFLMNDAMAAIVVIALLSIVLTSSVGWLERRFTSWSSSV